MGLSRLSDHSHFGCVRRHAMYPVIVETAREPPMKAFASLVALFVVAGCVSVTATDPPRHEANGAAPNELRVAFDITDGNPKALLGKLTTIDVTRKQLIERGVAPKIVLAFRGDASYFTQTDMSLVKEGDREDAAKIQA